MGHGTRATPVPFTLLSPPARRRAAARTPTPRGDSSQRGRPTWSRRWVRSALDPPSWGGRLPQIQRPHSGTPTGPPLHSRWSGRRLRGGSVKQCEVLARYVCIGVPDTIETPPFLGSATTQNPPPPEGVWVRLPPPVPTQRPRTRSHGLPDVLPRRILRSAMAARHAAWSGSSLSALARWRSAMPNPPGSPWVSSTPRR